MRIELLESPLNAVETDALLVGHWENEPLSGDLAELNGRLEGVVADIAGLNGDVELSGKRGELLTFYTQGRLATKRLVVVGLGRRAEANEKTIREATGAAVRHLRDRKCRMIASLLHRAAGTERSEVFAQAAAEGAALAVWEPGAYLSPAARKTAPETFQLVEPDAEHVSAVRAGMERGSVRGESINLARTLTNEPANALPPVVLAERARVMAKEVGLGCEVLDEAQMKELEMGAILAVSVGSEQPAQLIVLKHMPNPGAPVLALVGKGVTFDTGGISIKPTEGMGEMKGDMAGAASVIGAMRAIALLKIPVNVIGVAPCAENMPDGKAYRPGDVLRCMNGKTVEIMTTDAEGRLLLADALTYTARNLQAQHLVDIATLTGACVIALGTTTTAAMTNNAPFLASVCAAAETAGERVWELPLFDEYKEQIKSPIADLRNSGGRAGGAITAGKFLQEFVDEVPWVHLDIAGKGSTDTPPAHTAKGATGVMVRTFVELAQHFATTANDVNPR